MSLKKNKYLDFCFKIIYQLEKLSHENFFGKKILASKEEYINLFNFAANLSNPSIDKYEKETGFQVKSDWLSDLALNTQIVKKPSKPNFFHGRLLYSTVMSYIDIYKPKDINIIETGTARGFSSICMSKAINDSKINGKIYTFDILPHNSKMIWNNISDSDGSRSRKDLLEKWKDETKNIIFLQGSTASLFDRFHIDRCNIAFIDAEHTYKAVLREFIFIEKIQIKNDIIIFDDVDMEKFEGIYNFINSEIFISKYSKKLIDITDSRKMIVATKL